MTLSSYIHALLIDELRWRTNLSESAIEIIAGGFAEKILARRHTVVPTYLTDEMYEAAKQVLPDIEFKKANELYRAAITEYGKHRELARDEDDQPAFW